MRSSHLFVVLIGVMPLLAFATTMWLTDGAPFDPFGGPAIQADDSADAEVPAASAPKPATQPAAGPAMGVAGDVETAAASAAVTPDSGADEDADWVRLRRRAGAGDTDAALLLVILDEPRNHGSRHAP